MPSRDSMIDRRQAPGAEPTPRGRRRDFTPVVLISSPASRAQRRSLHSRVAIVPGKATRTSAGSLQRRRIYRWVAAVGLLGAAEDQRGADVPETNAIGHQKGSTGRDAAPRSRPRRGSVGRRRWSASTGTRRRRSRPTGPGPTSTEIATSLGDLESLFANAEPATRHRIVAALFEQVEVLGPNEVWLYPTIEAEGLGWATAMAGEFRFESTNGRGERI
jgi:hypothetical protein